MATRSRAVVVGGSIGGLTAAETLREEGYDGQIVLVGDEADAPYTRPPLSKQVLAGEWGPEQAAVRTAAELADLDVELRTGCAATGLDLGARTLHTAQGPIAFDDLVIATGSAARRHPLLPGAHTLRTGQDAVLLREALVGAGCVGIVGAGILGAEIAAAARKHGVAATLIGLEEELTFGSTGTLLSARLADLHAAHGVEVLLSTEVVAADGTALTFADGTVRAFDLVVVMIGAVPNTGWLEGSGLPVGNGVLCDASGLAAPGVHAVGDVAAWLDPTSGRHVRVEHQSNAIEQAIAVATRIVRGTTPEQPVPLFWSEIHGTRINAYGWFDQSRRLTGETPEASVLSSLDADGRVRGVVGWNAPPREFRTARAAVTRSARSPHVEGAVR